VGRLADLDAVTLDANGTLVELVDPVPTLVQALRDRGVDRALDVVRRGFAEEAGFYATHAPEGRDTDTLAALHERSARIFLAAVGAELAPAEFAPAYVAAMEFRILPTVPETLERLRRCGLALAVVGNWDMMLRPRLEQLGIARSFEAIVAAAEAGVAKPDPRIFELALDRLRVRPERALHIGDGHVDEDGARAAGMRFEWAPVATALASWTA
jgi:putative hydrolase of the HAD superfamily